MDKQERDRQQGQWTRCRFVVQGEPDYRPVTFPPSGPYWCSGYDSDDNPIIVAWLPPSDDDPAVVAGRYWPEAGEFEVIGHAAEPQFSGRFPRPEWWQPKDGDSNG